MKVDRNQDFGGVPLRLQIAKDLLAAAFACPVPVRHPMISAAPMADLAMKQADALIAAHNATCEETPQ